MTPKEFVNKYYAAANSIYQQFGVPALVTLAQAAAESQWGKKAPGNNFFGYTAPSNYNGNRQLLKTVEYHSSKAVKYPVIIKIEKVGNQYRYYVKRWFKAYNHPLESFTDYAKLLSNSSKYEDAFNYDDPKQFLKSICDAGYATSTEYYTLLSSIISTLNKYVK